jgi:penicillin V acylase-like amidase (Ntn superfamily)
MMDTIRILHGFDIVPGTVIEDEGGGRMVPLLTMWSTVCNLTGKSYTYNSIDDPTWYQLDLNKLDFSKSRTAKLITSGWLTPATV